MNLITKILWRLSLVICGMLAAISLVYVVSRNISSSGATDFHSYWYAGHFVRQGLDPYTAFINNTPLPLPIVYLDGHIQSLPIAQPGLARVPANTAPMVILLSIFSFFSWTTAKILWMTCNLMISLITPLLVIRMFPRTRSLPLRYKILIVLLFISLFGTRNVLGNGQTSLLVFLAMLLAILLEKEWLLGGVALGIALSKYSLAVPAVVLLMIERRYRPVIVGVIIQIFGLLALAIMSNHPPADIVKAYVKIAQLHIYQPGIHLATIFPWEVVSWLMVLLLSAGVAIAIGCHIRKSNYHLWVSSNPLIRPMLFNILMIWTLLAAYHRAYDTFVVIIFLILVVELLIGIYRNLSAFPRWGLAMIAIWVLLVMTLPARGVERIGNIPSTFIPVWLKYQSVTVTISLLIILCASIWILYHIKEFDDGYASA